MASADALSLANSLLCCSNTFLSAPLDPMLAEEALTPPASFFKAFGLGRVGEAEAARAPAALDAAWPHSNTGSLCLPPGRLLFQTMTSWSEPPVAQKWPSEEKFAQLTAPTCPCSVYMRWPSLMSQTYGRPGGA